MAMMQIDYDKELNLKQRDAVFHGTGPALIIAGAGTGKTRTLVYRVARLVESGRKPGEILLLTFTRRAAQEMLTRASRLLADERARGVNGGTFHAFANSVLRRFGKSIQLAQNYTIIDRADAEDILQHLRTELGFSQKGRRFPAKRTCGEIFSKTTNIMAPMELILRRHYPQFARELDALRQLHESYFLWKQDHALLDYDDLLLKFLALLERDQPVCEKLSAELKHILVDEYQDTNRLQSSLLTFLAGEPRNIVAVGDDAQSIYSFRGASFRNIMDFPNDFPGAAVITLEQNYRSTQEILSVANSVQAAAREKYEKKLFTTKEKGTKPILVACESEIEQSRFLADRILELREGGVALEDIAVLFRSSFHSFDLETELARRNIPFVKYGGFKFMETAHVKDVIAHLRLFHNARDVVSAQRVFLLLEGIGPVTARLLAGAVSEHASLSAALPKTNVSQRIQDALYALNELFEKMKRHPDDVVMQVMLVSDYLRPIIETRYVDDYPKRLRDLEHLSGMARRFSTTEKFLSHLAIDPPEASIRDVNGVEDEEEPLTLSTVHSAKGLEWHTVFVIWALDGFFPADYSFMTEEDIEEERRLMYVAITRAKEGLYITYPVEVNFSRGTTFGRPSRFLDGVPQDILPIVFARDKARSFLS